MHILILHVYNIFRQIFISLNIESETGEMPGPPVDRMKSRPRTCSENRAVLCVSCFEKDGNNRPINSETEQLIKQYHPSGQEYDSSNPALPTRICLPCKAKLIRLRKVGS